MKNFFKVKAMLRIAGIIALVAVIGFSMAACGNNEEEEESEDTNTGSSKAWKVSLSENGIKGDQYLYLYIRDSNVDNFESPNVHFDMSLIDAELAKKWFEFKSASSGGVVIEENDPLPADLEFLVKQLDTLSDSGYKQDNPAFRVTSSSGGSNSGKNVRAYLRASAEDIKAVLKDFPAGYTLTIGTDNVGYQIKDR